MLIAVCLITLSLMGAPKSAAQEKPEAKTENERLSSDSTILPTDIPIQMSADRLSFNYEANTYTARGNVTLSQGNTRLRADSITYEGNTGKLTAQGKVIVRTDSDVVEADEVTIKLADATGVLFNGKLLLSRHNVYLEGKKLERTGHSTYHIEEGSFTTCDGARPDWRITGKDLDVTLEGYGTLKHGLFYIKDVPVFYVPWLIYPAKRQRQTGFLLPHLSNSSLRGFDLRVPFFVSLSPSADSTIVPRICTKRAAQVALEFRYIPYEDFRGRFYGEYTYDWLYGPEDRPKSHRFFATIHHDQDLAGLATLKADGTWVSDRDYFELWGGGFDRRKRVRYIESNMVIYKQWNNLLFQAEARHFDNLDVPDNAVTVQNLPIVTGTLFNQQIPYTPFYLNSNVVYNYFYAPLMHNQWLGSRLQMNARIALPITLGTYLKMEPSFTYFAKGYAASYYRNNKIVESVNALRSDLYQISGDIFTDIDSVYSTEFLGFQRMKHTVRPRLTWSFRPATSQESYPYFDDTDRVEKMNLITAEIRQTLTGRIGSRQYLDFMTLSLSQGFDVDRLSRAGDSQNGGDHAGYGWTNTQAELTLRPHILVDLVSQAEYNPVVNRLRKYSVGLGLMDHRGDTFRVFHQFAEGEMRQDLNRQTNVNVQAKVGSNLDCFFESQYTHQFNFAYFTSLGLVYHPQCWNVELKYSEARSQDPVTQKIKDPDQTIFMTVSLYGLGQVYRMSRDWADFLGSPFPLTEPAGR